MASSTLFDPKTSKPSPLGKESPWGEMPYYEKDEGQFCNTQATPMWKNSDQEYSTQKPKGGK